MIFHIAIYCIIAAKLKPAHVSNLKGFDAKVCRNGTTTTDLSTTLHPGRRVINRERMNLHHVLILQSWFKTIDVL